MRWLRDCWDELVAMRYEVGIAIGVLVMGVGLSLSIGWMGVVIALVFLFILSR